MQGRAWGSVWESGVDLFRQATLEAEAAEAEAWVGWEGEGEGEEGGWGWEEDMEEGWEWGWEWEQVEAGEESGAAWEAWEAWEAWAAWAWEAWAWAGTYSKPPSTISEWASVAWVQHTTPADPPSRAAGRSTSSPARRTRTRHRVRSKEGNSRRRKGCWRARG